MIDRCSTNWALYSNDLTILETFNPISECQLHEHRFLYDYNSNFLDISKYVWNRSNQYGLLNGQMKKAKLGFAQTSMDLWLIRGYSNQNKGFIKGRRTSWYSLVYPNSLTLRERWSPDQEKRNRKSQMVLLAKILSQGVHEEKSHWSWQFGRFQAVHILGKHHLSSTTAPFVPSTLGSSCNRLLEIVPGSSESGHLEDRGLTTPLLLIWFHLHLLHISPLCLRYQRRGLL